MISDRYIDDIINDGQPPKDDKSDDVNKIVETLALKIDNKIDAALKKFEEKLSKKDPDPTPKDPDPTPKDPEPTPKDPEPAPNE